MIPAIFNKSRLLLLILALYGLHAPVEAIAEQQPPVQNNVLVPAISENATVTNPLSALDNTNLPQGMLDLMQASRSKYLEGSNLIKAGNSNKARESFDKAVDLLLQSDWDLPSTPKLMQFFQDLVQQIQEDESRYLPISNDFDEGNEASVLDELNDLDLIPIEVDPALKDALRAISVFP